MPGAEKRNRPVAVREAFQHHRNITATTLAGLGGQREGLEPLAAQVFCQILTGLLNYQELKLTPSQGVVTRFRVHHHFTATIARHRSLGADDRCNDIALPAAGTVSYGFIPTQLL